MPILSLKEVVLDIADWALLVSRNKLTSTSRYEHAVAASTARPAGTNLSRQHGCRSRTSVVVMPIYFV